MVCHNLFDKITGQSFLTFIARTEFLLCLPQITVRKSVLSKKEGKPKSRTETKLHCQVFTVRAPVIKPRKATQRGALGYHIIPTAKLLTDVSN